MKDKDFARSKGLVFVVFLPWLGLLGWMAEASWFLTVPGMPMLTVISNHLLLQLTRQFIGMRSVEHRNYAATRIRGWQLYENMERDAIPSDAVIAVDTVGIPPYYVPDLTVVDRHGLTDATVARNPVTRPNHRV